MDTNFFLVMGGDYSQKHGIEFGVTLCADTRKKNSYDRFPGKSEPFSV